MEAFEALSAADKAKRQNLEAEGKAKMANPNYFVSKTRLSVHNIPVHVDEKALKRLFLDTAQKELKKPCKVSQVSLRDFAPPSAQFAC